MRLTVDQARERFANARVARLATVDGEGAPHLVPVVFALDTAGGVDTIYTAVDAKPKRTAALRRISNLMHEPRTALLADHYAEDWTALWWARADGEGRVLDDVEEADVVRRAIELLTGRYPQYRAQPPPGPVLAVEVRRWSGWAFTDAHDHH